MGRVSRWKITKRVRSFLLTGLTVSLLKVSQHDQILPGGHGERARWSDLSLNQLDRMLAKIGSCKKKDIEAQKLRPSWEEDSEEPEYSLVRDTLFVSGLFQLRLRVCIHLFICNARSFQYTPKGHYFLTIRAGYLWCDRGWWEDWFSGQTGLGCSPGPPSHQLVTCAVTSTLSLRHLLCAMQIVAALLSVAEAEERWWT